MFPPLNTLSRTDTCTMEGATLPLPEPSAATLRTLFFPPPDQAPYADLVQLKREAQAELNLHAGYRLAKAIVDQAGLTQISNQFYDTPRALRVSDGQLDTLKAPTILQMLESQPLFKFWCLKAPWNYTNQFILLPKDQQPNTWTNPWDRVDLFGQLKWTAAEPLRFRQLRWINSTTLSNATNPLFFFQPLSCMYQLFQDMPDFAASGDDEQQVSELLTLCGFLDQGTGGYTRSGALDALFDNHAWRGKAVAPSLYMEHYEEERARVRRALSNLFVRQSKGEDGDLISTLDKERKVVVEAIRPLPAPFRRPEQVPAPQPGRLQPQQPRPLGRPPSFGTQQEREREARLMPMRLRSYEISSADQNYPNRTSMSSSLNPVMLESALVVAVAAHGVLREFVRIRLDNAIQVTDADTVYTFVKRHDSEITHESDRFLLHVWGCWEALAMYTIGILGTTMLWSYPTEEFSDRFRGNLDGMTVEKISEETERLRASPNALRSMYQLLGGPAGGSVGGDEIMDETTGGLQRASQRGGLVMEGNVETWTVLAESLNGMVSASREREQLGLEMMRVKEHRVGPRLELETIPGDIGADDFFAISAASAPMPALDSEPVMIGAAPADGSTDFYNAFRRLIKTVKNMKAETQIYPLLLRFMKTHPFLTYEQFEKFIMGGVQQWCAALQSEFRSFPESDISDRITSIVKTEYDAERIIVALQAVDRSTVDLQTVLTPYVGLGSYFKTLLGDFYTAFKELAVKPNKTASDQLWIMLLKTLSTTDELELLDSETIAKLTPVADKALRSLESMKNCNARILALAGQMVSFMKDMDSLPFQQVPPKYTNLYEAVESMVAGYEPTELLAAQTQTLTNIKEQMTVHFNAYEARKTLFIEGMKRLANAMKVDLAQYQVQTLDQMRTTYVNLCDQYIATVSTGPGASDLRTATITNDMDNQMDASIAQLLAMMQSMRDMTIPAIEEALNSNRAQYEALKEASAAMKEKWKTTHGIANTMKDAVKAEVETLITVLFYLTEGSYDLGDGVLHTNIEEFGTYALQVKTVSQLRDILKGLPGQIKQNNEQKQKEYEDRIRALTERHTAETADLPELQRAFAALRNLFDMDNATSIRDVYTQINNLKLEKESLELEKTQIMAELQRLRGVNEGLAAQKGAEFAEKQREIESLKEQLQVLLNANNAQDDRIRELEIQIESLTAERDRLQGFNDGGNRVVAQLKETIQAYETKIAQLQNELTVTVSENDARNSDLQQRIGELQTEKEQIEAQLRDHLGQYADMERSLSSLDQQLQQKDAVIKRLEEKANNPALAYQENVTGLLKLIYKIQNLSSEYLTKTQPTDAALEKIVAIARDILVATDGMGPSVQQHIRLNPKQADQITRLWNSLVNLRQLAAYNAALEMCQDSGLTRQTLEQNAGITNLWQAMSRLRDASSARDILRATENMDTTIQQYIQLQPDQTTAITQLWTAITNLRQTAATRSASEYGGITPAMKTQTDAITRLWQTITNLQLSSFESDQNRKQRDAEEQMGRINQLWESVAKLRKADSSKSVLSATEDMNAAIQQYLQTHPEQAASITQLWGAVLNLSQLASSRIAREAQTDGKYTQEMSKQTAAITNLWERILRLRQPEAGPARVVTDQDAGITQLWQAILKLKEAQSARHILEATEGVDGPIHEYVKTHPKQLVAITELWGSMLRLRQAAALNIAHESAQKGTLTKEMSDQAAAITALWGAVLTLRQDRGPTASLPSFRDCKEIKGLWEAILDVNRASLRIPADAQRDMLLACRPEQLKTMETLWESIVRLQNVASNIGIESCARTPVQKRCSEERQLWEAILELHKAEKTLTTSAAASRTNWEVTDPVITALWESIGRVRKAAMQFGRNARPTVDQRCAGADALWAAALHVRELAAHHTFRTTCSDVAKHSECDQSAQGLWEAVLRVQQLVVSPHSDQQRQSSECDRVSTNLWEAVTAVRGSERDLLRQTGASQHMMKGCDSADKLWEASVQVMRQMMRVSQNTVSADSVACKHAVEKLWESALTVQEKDARLKLLREESTDNQSLQRSIVAQKLWEAMSSIKDLVIVAESGDLIMQRIWDVYRDKLAILYSGDEEGPPEDSPFSNIDQLMQAVQDYFQSVTDEQIEKSDKFKLVKEQLDRCRESKEAAVRRGRRELRELTKRGTDRVLTYAGDDDMERDMLWLNLVKSLVKEDSDVAKVINRIDGITTLADKRKLVEQMLRAEFQIPCEDSDQLAALRDELQQEKEKVQRMRVRFQKLKKASVRPTRVQWRYAVEDLGLVFHDSLITALQSAVNVGVELQMSQLMADSKTATGSPESDIDWASMYPYGHEFDARFTQPDVEKLEKELMKDKKEVIRLAKKRELTATDLLCGTVTWPRDSSKLEQLRSALITLSSTMLNQRAYDRARSYLPTNFSAIFDARKREQVNVLLAIGGFRFRRTWLQHDAGKCKVWLPQLQLRSSTRKRGGRSSSGQSNKQRIIEQNGGIVSWEMLTGGAGVFSQ